MVYSNAISAAQTAVYQGEAKSGLTTNCNRMRRFRDFILTFWYPNFTFKF